MLVLGQSRGPRQEYVSEPRSKSRSSFTKILLIKRLPTGLGGDRPNHFKGSRYIEEAVFFHRMSRTLILADLIENFEREKVNNHLLRLLILLAGNTDPNGKTPIDLRLTFFGRKTIARRSLRMLLQWQPENIVFAYGWRYDIRGNAGAKTCFSLATEISRIVK